MPEEDWFTVDHGSQRVVAGLHGDARRTQAQVKVFGACMLVSNLNDLPAQGRRLQIGLFPVFRGDEHLEVRHLLTQRHGLAQR
jgi:hypothetical protein